MRVPPACMAGGDAGGSYTPRGLYHFFTFGRGRSNAGQPGAEPPAEPPTVPGWVPPWRAGIPARSHAARSMASESSASSPWGHDGRIIITATTRARVPGRMTTSVGSGKLNLAKRRRRAEEYARDEVRRSTNQRQHPAGAHGRRGASSGWRNKDPRHELHNQSNNMPLPKCYHTGNCVTAASWAP